MNKEILSILSLLLISIAGIGIVSAADSTANSVAIASDGSFANADSNALAIDNGVANSNSVAVASDDSFANADSHALAFDGIATADSQAIATYDGVANAGSVATALNGGSADARSLADAINCVADANADARGDGGDAHSTAISQCINP